MRVRSVPVALVLMLPLLLGGCVAAVIPLAAGGVLAGKDELGLSRKDEARPQRSDAPPEPEPVAITAPVPEPVTEATLADTDDSPEAPASELPPTTVPAAAQTPSADMAPPAIIARTPVSSSASPPAPALDSRAYDALYTYVDQQARRDPVELPRQSALLLAPGSLSPVRTNCSIRPPALLIDLDPADRVFDPDLSPAPNPALSQMLASLRLQAIDVFWISKIAAVRAGAVRKALVDSGLDPAGRDGLLLMRKLDDRKQLRRRELDETHCVVAIAGDTRADFDELYLYLKDTAAAQSLEELIGAGWFLAPLPLTEGTPP